MTKAPYSHQASAYHDIHTMHCTPPHSHQSLLTQPPILTVWTIWSPCTRGRTYAKKLFFTQKKSRLRKSENAVRLLYTKNSDLTHQNAFSRFFFFLHPAEKVCRALALGLNILDFPRPLPSPFPITSRWRDAGACVTMTPIDTDHAHTPCVPQIKMQLDEVL